jgi:hypothetical protein
MEAAEFNAESLAIPSGKPVSAIVEAIDAPPTSKCRCCGAGLTKTFIDLGYSPLANSYFKASQLNLAEKSYPLRVFVCEKCLLVQLEEFESPDAIFSDYAYFSSFSTSHVEHAHRYCDMMIERFKLGSQHQVVEIASNDGYLLQWFKARNVKVLGVEPAANIARVAWETKGIPSIVKFFGVQTAREMVQAGQQADVLLGNNVLAHVPNVHDFVGGMKVVLKPSGVITMEFPHLQDLIDENQFDTIYHEHFSYFSFHSVHKIFKQHALELFDVEEIPTHGDSLRIFAWHAEAAEPKVGERVIALMEKEERAKLDKVAAYEAFWSRVKKTKFKLLHFLVDTKEQGKSIAAYGAPAKDNTLLNYCGVGRDFIDYTVDRSPYKQGMFLPGSHIPIFHPDKLKETKPDYVLILAWNFKDEIMEQTAFIREWGGKWVVPIPEAKVIS